MTIENNDVLLVNRGSDSYQIKYEKIKEDVADYIDPLPEANLDGKQYGRQDAAWTEIVHTPEYTDADVDAHLNVNQAVGGHVLSWTDGDYKWVADQQGSSDLTTYTHPSGISRSVQSRLEDHTSVKDFGAKGDGITDDTNAIQACIDWVGGTRLNLSSAEGTKPQGGTVYFPAGTYRVKQSDVNNGLSYRKMCALLVPYDNVHLVGAGRDSTRIKAIDLNPGSTGSTLRADQCYGIIQVLRSPMDNPPNQLPIQGGSVRDMTLDNHVNSLLILNGGTLSLKGVKNYLVDNVAIKNSGFYGIGMQNGGFENVTIQNVLLKNINRDGIDIKDNGAISWGTRIDNVTCELVCRSPTNGAPFACLDLQGEALQVSNITIREIGSGDAGAGLRIKQGDSNRGNSGWYSSISNVYIEYDANVSESNKVKYGIQIKARGVSVFGAKVRGNFEYGINVEQSGCSLIGCYVQGDRTDNTGTIGCFIEPRSTSDDIAYPDLGGEYTMIQGCTWQNTYKSIQVRRPNCSIMGNAFFNSAIGIDLNGSDVTNAAVMGNTFCKDDDRKVKNSIYQKNEVPALVLNNVNDEAINIDFKRSDTQGPMMIFTAADGAEILKIGRGIGFYGEDPKRRQTVSGNLQTQLDDVVRDLIIELAQIGLITNSTTG